MSNIGKSSASSGSTISNSSLNPDNIISSSPSSRALIRKGFTIKCRGTAVNSVSLHLINVARTKAIKKPNEKIFSAATATGSGVESVDVILSERRRGKTSSTTSTEPCHVYDAVFHSLVVDKCYDSEPFAEQLIQLAIDCVQETFKVSIHKIGNFYQFFNIFYTSPSSPPLSLSFNKHKM